MSERPGSLIQALAGVVGVEQIPERLARAEAHLSSIGSTIVEVKQLILELGRRLEQHYATRAELEQRFAALEDRVTRLETRAHGVPPWVSVVGSLLIGLVSLLGGTLIGLFFKR